MELKNKTILKNKYIIEKVLSKDGGFSIIYLAKNIENEKLVVIKELVSIDTKRVGDKVHWEDNYQYLAFSELFKSEAKVLEESNHKNIVNYYDSFEENNSIYLVIEYVEGLTLREYYQKGKTLSHTMDIFGEILEGIEYIHNKNILHRDIKPDNIIINYSKEKNLSVKLIDFGSACWLDKKDDDFVRVTKSFSPIEMYGTESKQGFETDIYSVFATLYYMIEGEKIKGAPERIFEPEIFFNKNIDEHLRNLIKKNLHIELGKRDKSIESIKKKLVKEGENTDFDETTYDFWE